MSLSSSYQIKHAVISVAEAGDNTLVAAVAGKRICVVSMVLCPTKQNSIYLHDDAAAPVALLGDASNKIQLDPNYVDGVPALVLPPHEGGWFETSIGQSLLINLSKAQGVAGCLTYALI